MQDQIIAPDIHRLGGEFLARLLRPDWRVGDDVVLEHVLPAAAHWLHDLGAARGDLGAVVGDGGHGHRDPASDDILRDHRPLGVRVGALLLHEREVGVHEADVGDLLRGGVGAQQQVHLLLDRNAPRVNRVARLPRSVRVDVGGGEGHQAVARDAVGLRERDRLPRRASNAVLGKRARGRETPGAIHQHTDTASNGVGVEHIGDLLLTGAEVLATLALHARVGPRGAGELGRRECLEEEHLHRRIGLGVSGENRRSGLGAKAAAGECECTGRESGGREEVAAGGHANGLQVSQAVRASGGRMSRRGHGMANGREPTDHPTGDCTRARGGSLYTTPAARALAEPEASNDRNRDSHHHE